MISLKEVFIQDSLSVQAFENLAYWTIKTMAIRLRGDDVPKTLPLLENFTVLQDFDLTINSREEPLPLLEHQFLLPNLRMRRLMTWLSTTKYMLKWLNQLVLPNLTNFRFTPHAYIDFDDLKIFLEKYGAQLTTFGYTGPRAILRDVFPLTPHLLQVEQHFKINYQTLWKDLRVLPSSVNEILLARFFNLQVLHFWKVLGILEKALPQGSALRTFRHVGHFGNERSTIPVLWRSYNNWHDEQPDNITEDLWECVKEIARGLHARGISYLDEEGVAWMDVLND